MITRNVKRDTLKLSRFNDEELACLYRPPQSRVAGGFW